MELASLVIESNRSPGQELDLKKRRNLRRDVVLTLINEHRPDIFQPHKVFFDGGKGLYSSEKLEFDQDIVNVGYPRLFLTERCTIESRLTR